MLNMTDLFGVTEEKKDNKVIVNGMTIMVTDEIAMQVLKLCIGKDFPETVSQPEEKTEVQVEKVGGITKTKYVATKDFKPQYEVKKQVSADGKQLFCISRKNGWTKAEKKCMNDAIKSLEGIITIDVAYEKDGKAKSFKAWGYKTKKKAEEMMATLPSVFTVDQLNNAL